MTMRGPTSDLPIVLENVGFSAGASHILHDVSLAIPSGGPTVVIGPNGSGKTTLLRILSGLLVATRGCIAWGTRDAVPERLAIVFQRPTMLRRSAAANLRYALRAAHIPRAAHAKRTAELLALVGLEAFGERPARRLSGGEQQRLALARALARDPTVLLLDEPTASLDPAATKSVEEVIRAVAARGIKVVMTTHDLGAARRLAADVVMLHRGRVLATGPSPVFFSTPPNADVATFLAGDLLL